MHYQEVNNYIYFDCQKTSLCLRMYIYIFDYEDNMFINSLLCATISVWQESRFLSFKCRLPSYRCALLHRHPGPVRPYIYFILFVLFYNRLLLYNISIEIKKCSMKVYVKTVNMFGDIIIIVFKWIVYSLAIIPNLLCIIHGLVLYNIKKHLTNKFNRMDNLQ